MSTSGKNKIIRSGNPFEQLIYEENIRAIDLRIYRKQNMLVVVLNNSAVLQVKLSSYPELRKASDKKLSKWNLVEGGIGFEWRSLHYDINLKSLLEENAIYSTLQKLHDTSPMEFA